MVGPTNNISFRETPLEDLADASNTALIFVVVLDSFLLHAWEDRKRLVMTSPDHPRELLQHGPSQSTHSSQNQTHQTAPWHVEIAPTRGIFSQPEIWIHDLDSPNDLACGFLGKGTMKRPSSDRE